MNHGGVVTKILYGCSADVELIFGVKSSFAARRCISFQRAGLCVGLLEGKGCPRVWMRWSHDSRQQPPLATYTKLTPNFAPRRCIAFRGAKRRIDQEEGGWASIKREGSVHEVFICFDDQKILFNLSESSAQPDWQDLELFFSFINLMLPRILRLHFNIAQEYFSLD
ncbi:hypothetical protein F5146DRAFT_1125846 [Armillaria mellea]|nr:hypothetical protein F5146DRAFT_1125846 [Armillaria mellea]